VRRAGELTPDVALMDIRMPLASVGRCDLDRHGAGAFRSADQKKQRAEP